MLSTGWKPKNGFLLGSTKLNDRENSTISNTLKRLFRTKQQFWPVNVNSRIKCVTKFGPIIDRDLPMLMILRLIKLQQTLVPNWLNKSLKKLKDRSIYCRSAIELDSVNMVNKPKFARPKLRWRLINARSSSVKANFASQKTPSALNKAMSFSLSLISDQSNIQMLLNYRTKRTKPPNVLMNDREGKLFASKCVCNSVDLQISLSIWYHAFLCFGVIR